MKWSVIITSRKRHDDLQTTIDRLNRLDPPPDEVLVHLDECADRASFTRPAALLFPLHISCSSQPMGSVAARDQLIRKARGEFILSLDDDSYPEESRFLEKMEAVWAERPQTAAIWFPQRTDEFPATLAQTDFGPELVTGSYSSSGVCLRRQTYLQLPGYRREFFHAYEEPDYALQCHAAGWEVRFYPGLTIRHHYSAVNRNEIRTHHFHARNELWSAWLACPMLGLASITLLRVAGQFRYAWRRGPSWVVREPLWWARAGAGFFRTLRRRSPVSWAAYLSWLRLLHQPQRMS
jgi:GT2 family glycosyltransferase